MADSIVPKDPCRRRGVIKRLVCFTPSSLIYCDYLVARDRAEGRKGANRSEVIRRALRSRQILRHDLRATASSLLLLREMLLEDAHPTRESNAGLADIVSTIHQQLTRLTDPDDPEPLAGHLKGLRGNNIRQR